MSDSLKFTFDSVYSESKQLENVKTALKYLAEHMAYIGIPQEKNTTVEGGSVTLAELLFIHENGSPVRGIPARPVLDAAMKHSEALIAEQMQKTTEAALNGNVRGTERALELAGVQAANRARAYFDDPANGWAPNAPSTIARKKKRTNHPLVDEGTMRKAITYVVDKKGRDKR